MQTSLPRSFVLVRKGQAPSEPTRHGASVPKEVLVHSGVLPAVTQIAIATIPAGTQTEAHTHPTMWEVYYVLSGRAVYTIGDQQVEVDAGDFFAVPPNTVHCQRAIEEHRIYYFGVATEPVV